jgi:predicted small lipoprotein YifL
MRGFACLAALCLSLAACGLKGDLYLPPEPAAPPAAAPGVEPAPADPAGAADEDEATRRQLPAAPDRTQAQ